MEQLTLVPGTVWPPRAAFVKKKAKKAHRERNTVVPICQVQYCQVQYWQVQSGQYCLLLCSADLEPARVYSIALPAH